jgi:hypothetical protein
MMNRNRSVSFVVALVVALLWIVQAEATDRIFRDIVAISPSGQYEVQARSPDNKSKEGYRAFQKYFVYTFKDKKSGKNLWTRKQPMKTVPDRNDPSGTYTYADEASPVDIFVSDAGWTVIRTGWDEVIAVGIEGKDRCCIKLLSEAFTKEEVGKYVHQTTAGPKWSQFSLWYFLDFSDRRMFVVRPWWGRSTVIDLEKGRITETTKGLSAAVSAEERHVVLTELAKGVDSRKRCKNPDDYKPEYETYTAADLAGQLKIAEAVPLLRQLEDTSYCGCSVSGGLSSLEKSDGEVDPHSYEELGFRQKVQLSLRRLGATPKPLPVYFFEVRFADYNKNHPYTPKPLTAPRHANVEKIKKGMMAEQVLALIGSPDYVGYDTWEYDMDAKLPFTLILKWDARRVIGLEKKTPPVWQDGFARDKNMVW